MTSLKIMTKASHLLSEVSVKSITEASIRTSYCARNQRRNYGSNVINMENVNPNIAKLEYAVRGPLDQRAVQIQQELRDGAQKPFKQILRANLGDAQAMGQKPITFLREVLACVADPSLMETIRYPEDVKTRAKEILGVMDGESCGSYSWTHGIDMIRRTVAAFIERRDGHPSNHLDVVLTAGAAFAIKNVLQLFANNQGKPSGIMVPIPQYPLYSASIAEYGMERVGYYLDEDSNWSLNINELERAYREASKHSEVRAIVVINPGNPTGQVLTRKNIEDIIAFAYKHNLFILADEVYQDNIYALDSKFYSFKKVLMETKYAKSVEMASFMSISKGYMGECGLRGAWTELVNIDTDVQANLYKNISAKLCPTTLGQVAVDCYVRTPAIGEPSYDLFIKEKSGILGSLKQRSELIVETINRMPGYKCNVVQGAMYAFPRMQLPSKAVEAARKEGKEPDVFYAFRLLEETGICVVPGSGFGQKPGTYHFRTTILPQQELLKEMLKLLQKFHEKFTREFL